MIFAHRIIRRVSFGKFVSVLSQIQKQKSSLTKTQIMSDYIKQLESDNISHVHKIIEYGFNSFAQISERKMIKAVSQQVSQIQEEISKEKGCLARAIVNLYDRNRMPKAKISAQLREITVLLDELKNVKGKGSQELKEEIIRKLLNKSSNNLELEYVVRILIRNINIGMTDKVMLPLIQRNPASEFNPMLARSLRSLEQAVQFGQKKGKFATEIKYDGQRTMIFYDGQTVKMISRNGKQQKDSFPDLYERVRQELQSVNGLQNIVLDAEIVAVDRETLKPLPIQALISRKGKSRQGMNQNLVEKIMIFDILSKNNQNLTSLHYQDRTRQIPQFGANSLCTNVTPKVFQMPDDQRKLQQHFEQVILQGYEGLILKVLKSKYDTNGGRIFWAKLKKGCTIGDKVFNGVELDLVLMGADFGRGKRKEGYGSFLLGAPHQGKIVAVCKVGTGLSEEQLQNLSIQAQKLKKAEKPEDYDVPTKLKVDIWFHPQIIFEVSSQEMTRSPIYRLGDVGHGGLSLRFPKFIRRRDDKGVAQATTGSQIISLSRT